MKAEAFESRQKMRQEEIDAIAEAIGIIKEKAPRPSRDPRDLHIAMEGGRNVWKTLTHSMIGAGHRMTHFE